ncbi:MAG: CatB-related O-acetyltransferase [Crocinitomicaceae bacterium]
MKNSIANIPFVKSWLNYFNALGYKIKNKKLRIGFRNKILNSQFGVHNTLGDMVSIQNSSLGDYSYISYETTLRHAAIGKFCSIGPRCQIGLGKHPTTGFLSTHPLFFSKKPPTAFSLLKEDKFNEIEPITIGHDVWIGANVLIMDGVSIGNGAIIAAGSIVTKNVASFSIVKGAPAEHYKFRFTSKEIESIIDDPWWNKDLKWLRENVNTFQIS